MPGRLGAPFVSSLLSFPWISGRPAREEYDVLIPTYASQWLTTRSLEKMCVETYLSLF